MGFFYLLHSLRVSWNFKSQLMNKAFMFCVFRMMRVESVLAASRGVAM